MLQALEYLNLDYHLNYPLIRAIKQGASVLLANPEIVAVIKPDPNFILLAGANPIPYLNQLPPAELIEICGSHCIPQVAAHFGFENILECEQYYYPHPQITSDLQLERLQQEDLDFVMEHYHRLDRDEVFHAINEGRLFGKRDQGKLFAFIGLHDDFSMGMLEVLPTYRRQGWGEKLERALIAHLLSIGELPYGHVVLGNENSLHLQEKLGFTRCSDTVTWMW